MAPQFKQNLARLFAEAAGLLSRFLRTMDRRTYDDARHSLDSLADYLKEGYSEELRMIPVFDGASLPLLERIKVSCGCGNQTRLADAPKEGWKVLVNLHGPSHNMMCPTCSEFLSAPLSLDELVKEMLRKLNRAQGEHRSKVLQPLIDSEVQRLQMENPVWQS